jgi:SNF2 family DNA or RNA helicase
MGGLAKMEEVNKQNPKLEALIELLRELDPTRKVLVFNEYIKTGEIICARLKKEKVPHLRLYGATKKKQDVIDRFRGGKHRVLVINSQSGAFGLNLQVASVVVFYESPVDPVVRRQAEKRSHRSGQTRKVLIYDLIVKGSVDEKIVECIKRGENLFKSVVEGKGKKWLLTG